MSVTLKKEWLGEAGYCNCLLVAMSRGPIASIRLSSNQPPPNLEALVSRPDTCAWLHAQEFNYSALNTSKIIQTLASSARIAKSFLGYKPDSSGSILIHDCVENDGPIVERHFDLRLLRSGSVLHLTVSLDIK